MDETPVNFDMVGALMLDNRGVRVPKGCYSPEVVVKMHENEWIDEELMVDWLELVWKQRPGGQKRSLLVFDSFEGHLTISVKNKCYKINTVLGVIPSGLTSIVQPLDVSINKSFKDQLHEK
ncbi:268_t:CDS:2 [Dentiscutata erythropus]|uniref:268_t:CDS:1 n=1 Tax=Dentiscutata erythropus TaxID=1348616 RepID=A0A9N9P500_9GLOM|nr:268_t:CDS:2 [Dentiscutata erythropus]